MYRYNLESLGDDRFQHVCQAILAKDFPKTQFFAIGQPDGGRDALVYTPHFGADRFGVFQVKFVRKPEALEDPHKWLLDTLEGELPKIRKLIPKGAVEYFLLTNVPGTAHLGAGSIDKAKKLLESLAIPANCWWRDDLERKLDNAWDLKWTYPDIMSGTDILRLIIESGLTEDASRRTNAIQAYVRNQYEHDREVRFKQIELQNKLLDLFIDVPASLQDTPRKRRKGDRSREAIYGAIRSTNRNGFGEGTATLGAATLLLHPAVQAHAGKIVVEGAPGQGKSTIVQYICQMHRRRVLGLTEDSSSIPKAHQNGPARLPFKVDLRDLALWLEGVDPFVPGDGEQEKPRQWAKSLEAFLAAQVRFEGGGVEFNVDDLHAIAGVSALLVVCDGLDEVADIQARKVVVDEISKAAKRLAQNAVSVQVVVTSRPASFANSPGLSQEEFAYIELGAISRELIESYAQKWLKARNLQGRQAADVNRILKDKLDQPHLQDLARNPMQLSIVLSLINRYGDALPEKRTALYGSYVELFLSREAEKSAIVREYADLIIDIHRFIAWRMHSDAQRRRTAGRISEQAFRKLVTKYLTDEKHDVGIVDQLFQGMVDRVMALVSRVEGTFEFEVQPLREYFAACHLYATASYAPQGHDVSGTKPDIFDAIAKDFYWMNVTRFYAGCYDKGELSSLVDSLEVLAEEEGYCDTSHPQELAAILLGDWVFSRYPVIMQRVVDLVVNGLGLKRIASNQHRSRGQNDVFVLPKKCGNEQLLEACFQSLMEKPPRDYSNLLLDIISANGTVEEVYRRWFETALNASRRERTRWIGYGKRLGMLSRASNDDLHSLLSDGGDRVERMAAVIGAGCSEYYESSDELYESAVACVLDSGFVHRGSRLSSSIEALAYAIDPRHYAIAFREALPMPLTQMYQRRGWRSANLGESTEIEWPERAIAPKVRELVECAERESKRDGVDWATSLEPWNHLVENGRKLFGDCWAFVEVANIAAGLKSRTIKGSTQGGLYNSDEPLCERVRFARLQTGSWSWWSQQYEEARNNASRMMCALIMLSWAGPKSIERVVGELDGALVSLKESEWQRVLTALQYCNQMVSPDAKGVTFDLDQMPNELNSRTISALGVRANQSCRSALCDRYLVDDINGSNAALWLLLDVALTRAYSNPSKWGESLDVIRECYDSGIDMDRGIPYRISRSIESAGLRLDDAKRIVREADHFPTELVRIADIMCRRDIAREITPVGEVAEKQKWASA